MFKIYHFKKLNSTNDKAKEFEENSVIISDEQSKGKGRFKREWSSTKGGIYLSIVLKNFDPQYLTFIAAISAQKAIRYVHGLETVIKWPNDLVYNKKKICGILTKVNKEKAIVGIGINTNNKIPESLNKKAISLKKITHKEIINKEIINKLLNHFEKYLKSLKNKKYSKIINDWKKNSFLGSKVKVKALNRTYSGIAYDVDKDCFLIVKDKKGKKIKVIEGDVFIL